MRIVFHSYTRTQLGGVKPKMHVHVRGTVCEHEHV